MSQDGLSVAARDCCDRQANGKLQSRLGLAVTKRNSPLRLIALQEASRIAPPTSAGTAAKSRFGDELFRRYHDRVEAGCMGAIGAGTLVAATSAFTPFA